MTETPLRILAVGAHPDDCEITCGGTATLYRQAGHVVKFVSMTNGESGHHEIFGDELIAIRRAEAKAAALGSAVVVACQRCWAARWRARVAAIRPARCMALGARAARALLTC